MDIELRDIGSIRPYPGNPRVIPEDAVAHVSESLKRYGWRQPIVVDPEGTVIVGHTRLLAARRMGLEKVPVHVMDGDRFDINDTGSRTTGPGSLPDGTRRSYAASYRRLMRLPTNHWRGFPGFADHELRAFLADMDRLNDRDEDGARIWREASGLEHDESAEENPVHVIQVRCWTMEAAASVSDALEGMGGHVIRRFGSWKHNHDSDWVSTANVPKQAIPEPETV